MVLITHVPYHKAGMAGKQNRVRTVKVIDESPETLRSNGRLGAFP
jgi:hypothetical protein